MDGESSKQVNGAGRNLCFSFSIEKMHQSKV